MLTFEVRLPLVEKAREASCNLLHFVAAVDVTYLFVRASAKRNRNFTPFSPSLDNIVNISVNNHLLAMQFSPSYKIQENIKHACYSFSRLTFKSATNAKLTKTSLSIFIVLVTVVM